MIFHAATLCAVRQAGGGLEVLVARRAPTASFVGGAHVFPGGVVDPADGGPLAVWLAGGERDPWKVAAIRETYEEVGVAVGIEPGPGPAGVPFLAGLDSVGGRLNLDELTYLSTWVTPEWLPKRYDTRFFLVDADGDPRPDGVEMTEATWIAPADALGRHERGAWPAVSPTLAHLRFLAECATPQEAQEAAYSGRLRHLLDQEEVEGRQPPGVGLRP